jgi:hypothetical protein
LGFKPFDLDGNQWFLSNNTNETHYLFPSQKQKEYTNLSVPFTGKYFIGYKEAIAFRESQCQYKKINSLGYLGKYQFGMETLKTIGITDSLAFINSPRLQEKAFVVLLSKNKWELKDYIEKFDGKIVAGVKVTESGILAAAHLGGVGSVKRFLNTDGKRKCKDDYGTSVQTYIRDFGNYETAGIIATKNAKVE